MGMYDEVKFTTMMPDGYQNLLTYQTKDLGCLLKKYTIQSYNLWDEELDQKVRIDGMLNIYTLIKRPAVGKNWKEYDLRFKNGLLVAIRPLGKDWFAYE